MTTNKIEEAVQAFDEKFYSDTDKTCTWHRNTELRSWLRTTLEAVVEEARRDTINDILKDVEGLEIDPKNPRNKIRDIVTESEYEHDIAAWNQAVVAISHLLRKKLKQ